MKEFSHLLEIIDRLLGPNGCPWDREQTLLSMRSSLIEETYEIIDAIDLNQGSQIKEELGDLLFLVLFLSRLAEKEKQFDLNEIIETISEKLVRRHPHIFNESKTLNSHEVKTQWEEIKLQEKKEKNSTSELDDIPKKLPSLTRAQKIAKKLKKKGFSPKKEPSNSLEDQAGETLWNLCSSYLNEGVDAELSLRNKIAKIEREFHEWEQKN